MPDFNGKTWSCSDCKKAFGSTKAFGYTKEMAVNELGTDFLTFFTMAEWKLHRIQVHGEARKWLRARRLCDCWEGASSNWG